jgi:hypothetical protein
MATRGNLDLATRGHFLMAMDNAFYNNGATSGSLHGTPFVDPAVPNC